CRHLSSTFPSRLIANCLHNPSTNAVPRDERSQSPGLSGAIGAIVGILGLLVAIVSVVVTIMVA
ncbi:hypothetical protein, partial [Streptomyces pseudogriseolus]|uniref:hypothetical protein n=1 Tax=Streptomyces pseudogriseolus TaxID=36817 RepID=UPI003FA26BDF